MSPSNAPYLPIPSTHDPSPSLPKSKTSFSPPSTPLTALSSTATDVADLTKGIFLTLAASLGFGLLQLCVRLGITRYALAVPIFAVARGLASVLTAGLFLAAHSATPPALSADGAIVILRGFVGVASMLFRFESVARIPLAECTAILFITPALTLVLANFWLGEPVLRVEIIACVASFGAAIFIACAPEDVASAAPTQRLSGIVFAALGALFASFSLVVTRSMGKRVHSQWNVLSLGGNSLVIGLLWAMQRGIAAGLAPVIVSWRLTVPLLLGAGASSYMGASSENRALQLAGPGTVSILRSMDIPLSYVLAWVFLGEPVGSWQSVVGAAVLGLSAISLGASRMARS